MTGRIRGRRAAASGPDATTIPSRRGLILGLAGGAAAAGGAMLAGASPAAARDLPDQPESDGTQDRQPFYGHHQAGITTPQPASALVAAFDVLAEDKADLTRLLRKLTRRLAFLTHGGDVPVSDPKLPPPDSGVLGPNVFPDNLTATVALGASLFDERFGLAALRPRQLVDMAAFPNDALNADLCHGDILVQFNSNTAETNIHAVRDLIKNLPDLIALRWKAEGFLPPHTLKKQGRDTVRNLLGFKDGTANLDSRDGALMDGIVWVSKAAGEPAWAEGGTYLVVRNIRMLVERWDRTPLGEQEAIIGRHKGSGAPLGQAKEFDTPDYAGDPAGKAVPLDAHIRRANPRQADTEPSRILRRAYNNSRGLSPSGQLDMGLLFSCFQADLAAGFLSVQGRLNGEPLEEYIKPIGGGYFFALPGVPDENSYLGEGLMVSA